MTDSKRANVSSSASTQTPPSSQEKALAIIQELLLEYAEEINDGACDRCAQCSRLVMCAFHSVMSVLQGRTAVTSGAILPAPPSVAAGDPPQETNEKL